MRFVFTVRGRRIFDLATGSHLREKHNDDRAERAVPLGAGAARFAAAVADGLPHNARVAVCALPGRRTGLFLRDALGQTIANHGAADGPNDAQTIRHQEGKEPRQPRRPILVAELPTALDDMTAPGTVTVHLGPVPHTSVTAAGTRQESADTAVTSLLDHYGPAFNSVRVWGW